MSPESQKLLMDVFSILGFSEEEKGKALLDFKKKIAAEVLKSIKPELPEEYRNFLAKEGSRVTDPRHPMVVKMKAFLQELHSKEEYQAKEKKSFIGIFKDYIEYMKQGVNAETAVLLDQKTKDVS
ncbi:MAG: hypothetical protein HY434_00040 [Candidatus Liptonbacteria bacterium]|nr:hypothetical protein [Candidatus Liptonbacteria bacterium]